MKYRPFFKIFTVTSGATITLGLLLSVPTTASVELATTTPDTNHAIAIESTHSNNPQHIDPAPVDTAEGPTEIPTASPLSEPTQTNEPDSHDEAVSNNPEQNPPTQKETIPLPTGSIFTVPFFSQLTDISEASWKKVGCGITGLAMLIEYYYPGAVDSVDSLLHEGVAAGAYDDAVGWSYSGLISVAHKYNVTGSTHDYKAASMDEAFTALKKDLQDGPVMASVHYTFQPTNPIPHLVIINGIKNNLVYYNDPAEATGGGTISIEKFKSSWKKRYIEFYPVG